ncbi:hypothetical protein FB567DRAFT_610082 [Paraphoma chrysanthemicola]|uniref:ubiquitinyl hydrolase 1 n=1 Tax=Paraphoma chrysanthemicola TaxID=798071 RepID=A0A8K0RIG3_9PLEO|nr:hypothetical protein FB567DRAFT_610082 [Paraphoma chrysanthemicola]
MPATARGASPLQIYQHVVLPRDLPGRQDESILDIGSELVKRLLQAVSIVASHAPANNLSGLEKLRRTLASSAALNTYGKIDKEKLVGELSRLGTTRSLLLFVTEQNAAIHVYRDFRPDHANSVVFEAFETSATCEKVLSAPGALLWDFPGQAVEIPYHTFSTNDFQQSMSSFLEQASEEFVKHFAFITHKARAPLPEIRDTPDPTLITSALMTILEVNGSPHATPILRKRVRDTVSFLDARKPWRRSAYYLAVRVIIQRRLYAIFGADVGRMYYKIIMCAFISKLLEDVIYEIPSEAAQSLCEKLGRRLSKLEQDSINGSPEARILHHYIFSQLGQLIELTLIGARKILSKEWEAHIESTTRVIKPILLDARPEYLELKLPSSLHKLTHALRANVTIASRTRHSAEDLLGSYENNTVMRPIVPIMQRYFTLCEYEDEVTKCLLRPHPERRDATSWCTYLARKIQTYISTIADAYFDYPEFKSRQILALMELWVAMDGRARQAYPLLNEFHPGFDALILDVLELSTVQELERLRAVQSYIMERCESALGDRSKTIFDSPSRRCYGERHYDVYGEHGGLHELRRQIEENANEQMAVKEEEFKAKSERYASMRQELKTHDCVGFVERNGKKKHDGFCKHHDIKYHSGKIDIEIFEYPLPRDEPSIKAVIFELMCPEAFAAYRDATWSLLSSLAIPGTAEIEEVPLMRDWVGLRSHANTTLPRVTLGSSTKAHLSTHYATTKFPARLKDVSRPFGMRLIFYDFSGQVWVGGNTLASLAHQFPVKLPQLSPYVAFEHVGDGWPTSNEIIAGHTKCPKDVNVHEYMAWQDLGRGTHTRWLSLLRELGSTNINFSTESTWAILSRLCLQTGPASTCDTLRDIHAIFRDNTFCAKLLNQLSVRLYSIRRNWREPVQLDIIITILFKVFMLSPQDGARRLARELLVLARNMTKQWYEDLDKIPEDARNSTVAYMIWATVLWKRTHFITLDTKTTILPNELQDFMIASIALQDSLVGRFDTLAYSLRNAILRDFSLAYRFRDRLRSTILDDEGILLNALKSVWPVPDECLSSGCSRMYSAPGSWWITMTLSTKHNFQHHIHYNSLNGTLLVNGQQLGSLPQEYRQWPIVDELFNGQVIKTYPSNLPGMSFVVNKKMCSRYWVHFGFRGDQLVIQAEQGNTIFEYFHRTTFSNALQRDLPASLITDCYHWLNLRTSILEVRQQDPWKSKPGNWCLDLISRRATRNNQSTLVDPNSLLAELVALNFLYFEYPEHVTVFKPRKGPLRVELKRLELTFVIKKSGSLYCEQFSAIIAESQHQNIGTWHGLKSKLVFRTLSDPSQRTVLVPIGKHIVQRHGPHVSIVVRNIGKYLKFDVNDVLGRIDCPAEPFILHSRALWHALTAYHIPDVLTGRTGAEEALQYLKSGAYRPWTPLSSQSSNILVKIAELSPQRSYYPPSMRTMETIHWNPDLPIYNQDDRYRGAVNDILALHANLQSFSLEQNASLPLAIIPGDDHLVNRALYRTNSFFMASDKLYESRDGRKISPEQSNLATIATTFCIWPNALQLPRDLPNLLDGKTMIAGYDQQFDKFQITDLLEADLGLEWGALVKFARNSSKEDTFRLTFLFAILAFAPQVDMNLLRAIVAFALVPALKGMNLPTASGYSKFSFQEEPMLSDLMDTIKPARRACQATPKNKTYRMKLETQHEDRVTEACDTFTHSIITQWPSTELDVNQLAVTADVLLDRTAALQLILPEWSRLAQNFVFSQHIAEVQALLDQHDDHDIDRFHSPSAMSFFQPDYYPQRTRGGELPQLRDLLEKCDDTSTSLLDGASSGDIESSSKSSQASRQAAISAAMVRKKVNAHPNLTELLRLVRTLTATSSETRKRYGAELETSIHALSEHLASPPVQQEPFNPTKLSNDIIRAKSFVATLLSRIEHGLGENSGGTKWLKATGLMPRVTILTLLSSLSTSGGIHLNKTVRNQLIDLGIAITAYQRLLRIQDAVDKGRVQQMLDEGDNLGHTNWSPFDYADWLLLEVESNMMIRPEQVDVALATISPKTNQNSVLQLLMGKGKTSIILPMVALMLANKQNLFRIVVPKPLLLQSAQILQSKLGSILNREILHIPFSRRTPTRGGIILALPEHLLSFKLSGIQRLCDGKMEEAAEMINTQAWFDENARDVLDECDAALGIRTQLIYPSGSQQTVDGHPHRWQTVQALLALIFSCLDDLAQKYPTSIEIVPRSGVPLIYFLRGDVEQYLADQLLRKICRGQTSCLPMQDYSEGVQQDVHAFISTSSIRPELKKRIDAMFEGSNHLVGVLYHLRGLFCHRILFSTLKKRWNVQYGLHPDRDPIAVPYHAKGVPSQASEWGHPDVAIILTCLSFYYEGLSLAQFKQAFERIAKLDEPGIEYSVWVAQDVPEKFQNYHAINVEDAQQLRELHACIRYKPCLIDFYLNSFVFPLHAKQFSTKLSASGSDLVLFDRIQPSHRFTTGFSGTNDTRHQLPVTIRQNDLPQLAHTNAEVLAYLLEERNRPYVRMVDASRKRLSEEGLLRKLLRPNPTDRDDTNRIRILIDAGAQILEHDNRSLVKAWLKTDHEASAGVFFDSDHRAIITYQKGSDVPLVASPFAENLEKCLVYIDESHCRGTDLKLPPKARAAVTLGPHLTKDALVQAAMRLRLLGKSQSVTFFSPPEVHQSILDIRVAAKARTDVSIDSVDVVRWLLEQSCNAIDQLEPLYFSQSIDYLRRVQAKIEHPRLLQNTHQRHGYLDVVRTKETRSLKQLYGPKFNQHGPVLDPFAFEPSLRPFVREMVQRRGFFQDDGSIDVSSSLEEVEQEREMEVELECVREVQPPVHFDALAVKKLHPDIEHFALTGQRVKGSEAFLSMFSALGNTALGSKYGVKKPARSTGRLYVSSQFTKTVSVPEPNDNFIRPCHWLLWHCKLERGMLVSPEEANLLIPILRGAPCDDPTCHLIIYAVPVTRQMLHFNDMDYFAIPQLPKSFQAPIWLKVELGIFSGRLYFEWQEYEMIMRYLGMNKSDEDDTYGPIHHDEIFTAKSLQFLHEWLATRRRGIEFENTPMGFITSGKPLSGSHQFFSKTKKEEPGHNVPRITADSAVSPQEEYTEASDDDENAKEHLFQDDEDEDEDGVFHDAVETNHDAAGNTFFDGAPYVHEDEDGEKKD